jgi:hypothetical protein
MVQAMSMANTPLGADDFELARVEQAVKTVLGDFERTTTRTTRVTVSRVDGDRSFDADWAELEGEELVAEVAGHLQGDWMTHAPGVSGPFAKITVSGCKRRSTRGGAVWWCRVGHHSPARVGELGSSA